MHSVRLNVLLVGLLTYSLTSAPAEASDSPINGPAPPTGIRTTLASPSEHPLITQLGSEEYTERREAEAQLRTMGGDAFDLLERARNHKDLEIATQAEYILHLINQDSWVRENDSDVVRNLMSKYGQANDRARRGITDELTRMDGDEGIGALSRIAHFELSEAIAKHAALRILEQRVEHRDQAQEIAARILPEIGTSTREPVAWIRLYLEQLEHRDEILPDWLPLIDAEIAAAERSEGRDRVHAPKRLLKFHVQLSEERESPTQMFESLRRQVDYLLGETGESRRALYPSLRDLVEKKQWEVLRMMEEHYHDQIASDRLLLYQAAIAATKQGSQGEADAYSDQAFRLSRSGRAQQVKLSDELSERNSIADALAEWGYHNWAEREWRYVSTHAELTSNESMDARISLANWCLHDRFADKEAADLLAEVCDTVDADADLKNTLLRDNEARNLLTDVRRGREFFTACFLERQKDYEGQKKHLELAYTHQNWLQDPDILIAMYRLKGADESYRRKVQGRIRRAARQVEEYIQRVEESLAERGDNAKGTATDAVPYNHWAWLISNTEGDFNKAVEYSKRSLEFSPGSASYLDTLGRCYYAAGDLENAVKYQRQAVEKQPMVQVMQRQLALFEKDLDELQEKK